MSMYGYGTEPSCTNKPWTGAFTEALAKSHRKYIPAGAESSSAFDKELLASLPHTNFEPIECSQEESRFIGPIVILDERHVFRRRDKKL